MHSKWKITGFIAVGILVLYLGFYVIMSYTGSTGNDVVTGPDSIEYSVYGNLEFNAATPAEEILIPAVVNETGSLVFSDQDLLTTLPEFVCFDGNSSYPCDAQTPEVPDISYVKTDYGTMIAIHRPPNPRNEGQHFSFILKKENMI
jgi:hypothetical protein